MWNNADNFSRYSFQSLVWLAALSQNWEISQPKPAISRNLEWLEFMLISESYFNKCLLIILHQMKVGSYFDYIEAKKTGIGNNNCNIIKQGGNGKRSIWIPELVSLCLKFEAPEEVHVGLPLFNSQRTNCKSCRVMLCCGRGMMQGTQIPHVPANSSPSWTALSSQSANGKLWLPSFVHILCTVNKEEEESCLVVMATATHIMPLYYMTFFCKSQVKLKGRWEFVSFLCCLTFMFWNSFSFFLLSHWWGTWRFICRCIEELFLAFCLKFSRAMREVPFQLLIFFTRHGFVLLWSTPLLLK